MLINMRCIVIEDEPLAMERVIGYISKLPALNLVTTFDNALDAFAFLKTNAVDLIFLDINLGELSGIQLLESIKISSKIIITTAYPEFALKGYELNVSDYLLKPFGFDRFLQAIDRVQQSVLPAEPVLEKKFFFVKTENRLEKILYDDLIYIEGMRDYRKIHCSNKKIMTLQTFAEFEKEVPSAILCRVHKSYMVAIHKIDSVEKDSIHIHNTIIPVSETYKHHFHLVLGH
jgi:two-component system, LytTR family, response regulator